MNTRGRWLKANASVPAVLTALLLLIPALAAADGMAFRYDRGLSLEPLQVDEQRAFIAHKDGIQRMLIAINLGHLLSDENASRSAVWIFPVAGSPDRAQVDVTDFWPDLNGEDVEGESSEFMRVAQLIPMVTQPHFLPFTVASIMGAHGRMIMGMPQGAMGVTRHKIVDRWNPCRAYHCGFG